jgi:hypothetical protein
MIVFCNGVTKFDEFLDFGSKAITLREWKNASELIPSIVKTHPGRTNEIAQGFLFLLA